MWVLFLCKTKKTNLRRLFSCPSRWRFFFDSLSALSTKKTHPRSDGIDSSWSHASERAELELPGAVVAKGWLAECARRRGPNILGKVLLGNHGDSSFFWIFSKSSLKGITVVFLGASNHFNPTSGPDLPELRVTATESDNSSVDTVVGPGALEASDRARMLGQCACAAILWIACFGAMMMILRETGLGGFELLWTGWFWGEFWKAFLFGAWFGRCLLGFWQIQGSHPGCHQEFLLQYGWRKAGTNDPGTTCLCGAVGFSCYSLQSHGDWRIAMCLALCLAIW